LPFIQGGQAHNGFEKLGMDSLFCLTMLENETINYEACAGVHRLGKFREYGETFVPMP
jgi:hypothetical protein